MTPAPRHRDRRRRVVLGETLKARVEALASEHMRPAGREIVYLCSLALRAPVQPPDEGRGDLIHDEPKSGITYMAFDAAIDMAIVTRIRRTRESISQAVRTLVRYGMAIQDEQDAALPGARSNEL